MSKRIALPWLLALSFALAVAVYAIVRFEGAAASYRLWYYVPAAALVGSWLADRLALPPRRALPWCIDGAVLLLCAARPLFGWPPVSGHAVFVIHALLSGSHRLTRVLAVGVLAITLYAKIVLWHWDATLWPGLAIGAVAGFAWRGVRNFPRGGKDG